MLRQQAASGTGRLIAAEIRQLAASNDPLLRPLSPYPAGKGIRVPLGAKEGSGFHDYVHLSEDLQLVVGHCRRAADLEELYIGEGHIKINYHLSGRSFIQLDHEEPQPNEGLAAGFLIQPPGLGKREVSLAGEPHEHLTLICSHLLLTSLFPEQIARLPAPMRAFARGEEVRFGGQFRPSTEMVGCVRRLLGSRYRGSLRSVHSEAIALELLCATIDTLADAPRKDLKGRLKRRDIDRLEEAAALLRRDCANPPTLPQLSRLLGINQNKLTQGFRQRFSMTIAEYCQTHRMTEAARLLGDDSLTVYQVSELVGYDFPGNFAAAFKRHFGISPRRYRN